MEAPRSPDPGGRGYLRAARGVMRAVGARYPHAELAVLRAGLEEELAARGFAELPPEDLDRMAKLIADARGPLAPLRLARNPWRQGREIAATLEQAAGPEWLRAPAGDDLHAKQWWSLPVALSEQAPPFLERAFEALFDPDWDDDQEVAHTLWIPTDQPADAKGAVPLRLGEATVGSLETATSPSLERQLRRARRRKRPLRLDGFLTRNKDGGYSLAVNVPAA